MHAHEDPDCRGSWFAAAAFDPAARHPYFEPDLWGLEYGQLRNGVPDHVAVTYTLVPEGLHSLCRCDRCGARHESVVDFRSIADLFDLRDAVAPVGIALFPLQRLRGVEALALRPAALEWAGRHAGCEAGSRLDCEPPVPLVPALEAAFQEAVEGVRLGVGVPASAVLVSASGPVRILLAGASLPVGQFMFRETVRRAKLKAKAVIALAEGPRAGAGGDLLLACSADGRGWLGRAPIERFGVPGEGPGVVGDIAWSPLTASHAVLDGLATERRPFPVPRSWPNDRSIEKR